MSNRLCFVISFVLLVSVGGQSLAETINWTNADPNDNLWKTPGNWDLSRAPSIATQDHTRIRLQSPDACIIDSSHTGADAAETEHLRVGRNGLAGEMTMTGGTLMAHNFKVGRRGFGEFYMHGGTATTYALSIAKEIGGVGSFMTMTGGLFRTVTTGGSGQFQIGVQGGSGTLNMEGGTLNVGNNLMIGKTGLDIPSTGMLAMTGGMINVNHFLKIGTDGSTGTLQLYGGTISADQLRMENDSLADPCSIIDITAGTLILDGDVLDLIADNATDPNICIVADGGSGNLFADYDIRNPGKTTLTATSNDTNLPQLTINVEPNDIGIEDAVIPSVTEPIYYWQDQPITIVAGPSTANCPYVYRFDHWVGDVSDAYSPSTTVLMNGDKTITVVFVKDDHRVCGDECHPIQREDVNEDCYVNMADFALYAEAWLNCTHPDCDEL